MLRKTLVILLTGVLVIGLAVGLVAKKPQRVVEMQATKPVSESKLVTEALKAELKINETVATSTEEIKNALTLNEMLERAHHNDKKIARIIARFERYYGPIDSSPFYIEVYNAYVGESVWIDPIHICGQGNGW